MYKRMKSTSRVGGRGDRKPAAHLSLLPVTPSIPYPSLLSHSGGRDGGTGAGVGVLEILPSFLCPSPAVSVATSLRPHTELIHLVVMNERGESGASVQRSSPEK